ncbi:MAG: SusC/RagA family TonB-linked outer membrane protein [Gemmatimonadaceae bacterium]|nr:SusC/RagA family TonB-linked outer membrane protein [Gemmatimonadaceae bacterium]
MRQLFRTTLVPLAALALLPAIAAAQEAATITGRITGEGGTPLGAVTVSIAELGVGAQSRDDGRYAIVVPGARVTRQSVVLAARRVGYKPRSVRITLNPGAITQDFALETNPLQLGEVVITGAGTATEVEKLGSVRNTVPADLIVKANESNVVQALAAKAPGVDVTSSSGDPGASSSIKIRGLRTIQGSAQPLFVVDGVPLDNGSYSTTNFNPVDAGGTGQGGQDNGGEIEGTSQPNRMSDINPDDIESVEILKGAAAGAIYGSRAANGVVLITTKRGRAGATRYSLRSSVTNDDVTRKYPLQTAFGQGRANVLSASCAARTGVAPGGPCNRTWGPRLTVTPFDHASEAFRTGHQNDNVLSMSGGNERTTFYLSGNLNRNQGVFIGPNNYYDRSTARLNASHKLAETFTVGGNFAYADTRGHFTQRGNNVNGLLLGLLRTPPDFNNFPYLDPNSGLHRSYRLPFPDITTVGQARGFNNPVYSLYEELNQANTSRTFGNVNADWLANSWLKFNYTLGADYSNDERLEVCPRECSDVAAGGRITEGKIVNYTLDHNLTGTARYHVSDNFSGTFTLGQNLNARNFRTFSVVGRQMVVPGLTSISNTLARDPASDYQTVIHDEAYFGQLSIDLYQQLFLTAALRNDGSSTFGKENARNWFPKGSAAWTFTNLVNPGSMLTFGKVRLSYGQAGQEPAPYLTSPTYNATGTTSGISQGTGLTPTQSGRGGLFFTTTKPATSLRPERTNELEGGFDIGFLKDRADFSATFYKQHSSDVILVTPTSPSSGFSSEVKNGATIENSGTEFSLNLRPFTTQTQAWDIGLGWSRTQSLVTDISGADFLYLDASTVGNVAKKGSPLGVFFGLGMIRCGLSNPAELPAGVLDAACAGKPTGTLYIDDGTNCSTDAGRPCGETLDLRVLGDPTPKWTGNVRTGYRYKKLSLSGLLDIRKGGQVHNGTKGALWSYGTHGDTQNRAICTGRATRNTDCTGNLHVFGDADWYPGPVTGPGAGIAVPIGENWYRNDIAPCPFTSIDEQCIEDAGFVKLREISAGYTFDGAWVARTLGLSSVDVRIAGRNLKTWTKYTGLDPETSLGGSISRITGADYFNLPQTRSLVFTVGLNR